MEEEYTSGTDETYIDGTGRVQWNYALRRRMVIIPFNTNFDANYSTYFNVNDDSNVHIRPLYVPRVDLEYVD